MLALGLLPTDISSLPASETKVKADLSISTSSVVATGVLTLAHRPRLSPSTESMRTLVEDYTGYTGKRAKHESHHPASDPSADKGIRPLGRVEDNAFDPVPVDTPMPEHAKQSEKPVKGKGKGLKRKSTAQLVPPSSPSPLTTTTPLGYIAPLGGSIGKDGTNGMGGKENTSDLTSSTSAASSSRPKKGRPSVRRGTSLRGQPGTATSTTPANSASTDATSIDSKSTETEGQAMPPPVAPAPSDGPVKRPGARRPFPPRPTYDVGIAQPAAHEQGQVQVPVPKKKKSRTSKV